MQHGIHKYEANNPRIQHSIPPLVLVPATEPTVCTHQSEQEQLWVSIMENSSKLSEGDEVDKRNDYLTVQPKHRICSDTPSEIEDTTTYDHNDGGEDALGNRIPLEEEKRADQKHQTNHSSGYRRKEKIRPDDKDHRITNEYAAVCHLFPSTRENTGYDTERKRASFLVVTLKNDGESRKNQTVNEQRPKIQYRIPPHIPRKVWVVVEIRPKVFDCQHTKPSNYHSNNCEKLIDE